MPPWGSASRTACWRRRASTRATVSASGSTTGVRALLHTAHCTRTSHRAWHGLRRWYNGLNNAFRYDDSRRNDFGGVDSLSVGLGGNIEASLHELQHGLGTIFARVLRKEVHSDPPASVPNTTPYAPKVAPEGVAPEGVSPAAPLRGRSKLLR